MTGKLEFMGPKLGVALRYVKYYMSRDKIDVARERDELSLLLIISEFCGHESTMLRRPTMPEPEHIDHRAHAND